MTGSNLFAVVRQTCQRARSLRQDARESRWLAQAIKAHARQLVARLDQLEHTPAAEAEIQPIEPMIQPLTQLPVRESFQANRQELLTELKQSLRDLETLRMTPRDDPAVRELTDDIRKTIAHDATNPPDLQKPAPRISKLCDRT